MRHFGPFLPLVLLFGLLAGCELLPTKTVVRYTPSPPDTVVVDDDEDDG